MKTVCAALLCAALLPAGAAEPAGAGTTSVSLVGGQTTGWRPSALCGGEVLFMPEIAPWGKEVHGGIPVCWPWFGKRDGLPKHGIARYAVWRVEKHDAESGVVLSLESNEETKRIWPHDFRLELQVTTEGGDACRVRLTETNTGKEPFESAWGFHPYFRVTDAEQVAIDGERQPKPSVRVQTSAAEKGRRRVLSDLANGRTVTVECSDNEDWFVWNPGIDRTPLCETLSFEEWHRFYCLEPCTLTPRPLAPGASRTHEMVMRVGNGAKGGAN